MGTASNVLVGEAQAYTAPSNTAAPVIGTNGLVTPAAPWVEVGFTVNGLTFEVDGKTTPVYVDELSTPVLIVPDQTDVSATFEMSEDTLPNALIAYGRGSLASVAATTTVPGTDTLTFSDALNTLAFCFTGTDVHGLSRLVYIPNCLSVAKVSTKYQRSKAQRSYPVTLQAVCPMSSITITDATAPIT